MKASANFKETIKAHLEQRASTDALFAEVYKKDNKNLGDCITHILNWVKKSNCVGFSDDEIFGQAIHYYQEDNIKIGKPIKCKVVVNRSIEPLEPVKLTEIDKKEAHNIAMQKAVDKAYEKMKKPTAKAKKKEQEDQPTLFD